MTASTSRSTFKRPHVPAYREHKPSGQARVIIDGKQIYLGRFGTPESWEKYNRLVAERIAVPTPAANAHLDSNERGLTIVELGDAYREWAEGYYAKNGEATGHIYLIRRAVRALRELYGRTAAKEFGPQKLRAVQGQFVDADCARTYVNKICAEIRRVFKWGVSHELVPSSVYEALRTVDGLKRGRTSAREPKKIGPIDDTTVDATIPFLPPIVADMVRIQRLTGCRPGEACGIRPCDIDTSGNVWCYTPESHKTEHHGRERRIFIGPKAQDILRPFLLRDHQAYCFSPAESRREQHEAMRSRRKSKVQPSQADRRKRRPATQPGAVYTKDSYRRAASSWPIPRGAKMIQRPRCCRIGTPTSCGTARPRNSGGGSGWKPPRWPWATAMPT